MERPLKLRKIPVYRLTRSISKLLSNQPDTFIIKWFRQISNLIGIGINALHTRTNMFRIMHVCEPMHCRYTHTQYCRSWSELVRVPFRLLNIKQCFFKAFFIPTQLNFKQLLLQVLVLGVVYLHRCTYLLYNDTNVLFE